MRNLIAIISIFLITFCTASLIGMKTEETEKTFSLMEKSEAVPQNALLSDVVEGKKTLLNLKLHPKNVVTIFTEIDEKSKEVADHITKLSQENKEVYVLIDSPGGSVLDGAKIVSAIQGSKVPVYTVCSGLCASMAFVIFSYGTKRYMVDRSIIMAHPAFGSLQGTMEQMTSRLNLINNYINKMNVHIAKRAGLSYEKFHEKIMPEMWMDAEDAITNKFADSIVNIYIETDSVIPFTSNNLTKSFVDFKWK